MSRQKHLNFGIESFLWVSRVLTDCCPWICLLFTHADDLLTDNDEGDEEPVAAKKKKKKKKDKSGKNRKRQTSRSKRKDLSAEKLGTFLLLMISILFSK